MGSDTMILVFWNLSFKPTFSLSSFNFINKLFSSSSLSAIRVMSSAYLRLLIFLLAILVPVCASFRPAFHMIYSAYELNKQGDFQKGKVQVWPVIGSQGKPTCIRDNVCTVWRHTTVREVQTLLVCRPKRNLCCGRLRIFNNIIVVNTKFSSDHPTSASTLGLSRHPGPVL